jgi:heme O synthase-like polyprenyltransferase
VTSEVRPAFYALRSGGWRDYVTLVHPPYTLWHLSYAAMGAALAPRMKWGLLGWTVLAFLLAMGVGAHALDELKSRPLRTRIPDRVLVVLAAVSIAAASAIGIVVAIDSTLWLLLFVAFGAAVVVAYNLELFGGLVHTPLWFAGAWGAFPALTGFFASAQSIRLEAIAIAAFALVTSLVQQRLSVEVRAARRQMGDASLARPAETALQLLSLAMPLLAGALLLARWRY